MKYVVYWIISTFVDAGQCDMGYGMQCAVAHYKTVEKADSAWYWNRNSAIKLMDSLNNENRKTIVTAMDWETGKEDTFYFGKPYGQIRMDSVRVSDLVVTASGHVSIFDTTGVVRLGKARGLKN